MLILGLLQRVGDSARATREMSGHHLILQLGYSLRDLKPVTLHGHIACKGALDGPQQGLASRVSAEGFYQLDRV